VNGVMCIVYYDSFQNGRCCYDGACLRSTFPMRVYVYTPQVRRSQNHRCVLIVVGLYLLKEYFPQ
jgi:hypothetical protein